MATTARVTMMREARNRASLRASRLCAGAFFDAALRRGI
jgi:hypothetical protein